MGRSFVEEQLCSSIPELADALQAADAVVTHLGPTSYDLSGPGTGRANRWAIKIQARQGSMKMPRDLIIRGRGNSAEAATGDAVSQLAAWLLANHKEPHE
jgi:hypothetical protein